MKVNIIYCGDCIEVMDIIPDKAVDMILCDLPYGRTNNEWDEIIPFNDLWRQYLRIIKDNGAIVLTAIQPFVSQLVMSNEKIFKYDLIWEKTISSGQLNVNRQPMRKHEHILVFYKKQPTYNQQFTEGKPYIIKRKAGYKNKTYNRQVPNKKINTGFRHPTSILKFSNPRIKGGHSAQKPVPLFEYLIRTYTNEGDLVLDNCIGSGTTGVACINTKRNFIGIELNKKYAIDAAKRCNVELLF